MSIVHVLGRLPDPFLREDGTRVTPEEWSEYRKLLREKIVDIEFGGMPPKVDCVTVEPLNQSDTGRWYRVTAFAGNRSLSFSLELSTPAGLVGKILRGDAPKCPVLLTGDGCYDSLESDTIAEANRRGYAVGIFNRLEVANDNLSHSGGVYDLYPDYPDFTAISAWAWGYITVMDALEQLPFVNAAEVGITGHSRGGKTVLLAAACDERIRYVCPNNSGTHGCAAYRFAVTEQGENNTRSERLGDMLDAFPFWMGKKLTPYRDCVEELPYDMHFFGALIAPRGYLQCEGMQDYWINPRGSWQTFQAVKAAYRYLGCEEHAGAWFRPGQHRHKLPDFTEFLDFMDRMREEKPLAEHLQLNPYPADGKIFDWDEV